VSSVVRHGAVYLEQRVFLYDSYVKYGSAGKRRRKFRRRFRDERVPSRQTIRNLVNTLRKTGLLIDKKQKHKRRVLTEQKLDDIGARLVHTPTNNNLEGMHPIVSIYPSTQQSNKRLTSTFASTEYI
jgi:ribosomal protein S19E (S16A)